MLLRFHGFGGAEVMLIYFIAFVIYLAIYIPYLLTLQRALEAVSPDLRRMPPGQVWLMLIPLFSVIWIFMIAAAIADSFDQEYRRRGIMTEHPRPTYNVGLTYGIMALASAPGIFITNPGIKLFFSLFSLAGFILWIVYWVQVAEHKNKLNKMAGPFGAAQPFGQPNYGQHYNPQANYNQQQQYYQQPNYNQQQPPYGQQYQQPPQQQQQPPQNPDDPNRWGPPGLND